MLTSVNVNAKLIGLTPEEANAVLLFHDMTARIVKEDGNSYIGIKNLDMSRVNITVMDGLVTEAYIG